MNALLRSQFANGFDKLVDAGLEHWLWNAKEHPKPAGHFPVKTRSNWENVEVVLVHQLVPNSQLALDASASYISEVNSDEERIVAILVLDSSFVEAARRIIVGFGEPFPKCFDDIISWIWCQ